VHYKVLQYWLKRGIEITKVNKVLEFTEEAFVNPYMKKILDLRQAAIKNNDKIMSMVLKAMANGMTGRMQQSTEKFSKYKISLTESDSLKYMRMPNLNSFTVLNDECAPFEMNRLTIFYGNPILTASCILALSKLELFKMYDRFSEAFPKVELIMADTDSLVINIFDPKDFIWEFFEINKGLLDCSNLSKRSKLYSEEYKGCYGGIWKVVQDRIQSVISVRNKCYSIQCMCTCSKTYDPLCSSDHSTSRCSGVNRSALKKLDNDYYWNLLQDRHSVRSVDVSSLQSFKHNVRLVRSSKAAFHCFNASRKLLPDGINTVAHGYKGTMHQTEQNC
jgi:hypothetical protein